MHYDDGDEDVTPLLTDSEAAEVLALVKVAAGEHIDDEVPLNGTADDLIEYGTEHRLGECSFWVKDTMLNLSMCPSCASVSLSLLAKDTEYLHGFIEIVERLREVDGLGGNYDSMLCSYRRVQVSTFGDDILHAYVISATYWLDFDGVKDRVIHSTRALVAIMDEVVQIITDARARTAEE